MLGNMSSVGVLVAVILFYLFVRRLPFGNGLDQTFAR
jgi:hypothetical protein